MTIDHGRVLSPDEMEKTLKGIVIPPRPQILLKLEKEMRRDDPDQPAIVRLIGADVGLSAAILKTVNSPFFGLNNRISSVANAINLLGLNATQRIVTGLALRNSVGGQGRSLERFWDSAEKVAGIAAYIASTLPRGPRDDAYTFGLFHDIGIPMLMQKFPDYRQTLAMAETIVDRPLTALEDERHATNHATLGYLIGKGWFLPAVICEAILYHHDATVFDDGASASPQALTLIAIGRLAEHLHDEYLRMRANPEWYRVGSRALDHLGLSETEYLDLREELAILVR